MHEQQSGRFSKYSSLLSAIAIIVCFFLPWVKWINVPVSARDMATGNFYTLSETNFAITNPFPEMIFVNGIFWLIPALCIVVILIVFFRKTFAGLYGAFAGAMVLGLGVVYALFTNELQLFDTNIQLGNALQPAFYIAVFSAIWLIITSWQKKWLWKVFFLIAPLGLSYLAFNQIKESEVSEKTAATSTLKVAYTIDALKLINEFVTADSASNATYREKIMVVEGQVSELNASDAGATLSMADSTGSYVIFDFEKADSKIVQAIKAGDRVSVKGVCSGSIYSDILETQTISFKQSIIYSKK